MPAVTTGTGNLTPEQFQEYVHSLDIIGSVLAKTIAENPMDFGPEDDDSYLSIVQDQDTIIPFESTTEPKEKPTQLTDQEVYDILEEMETWSINMEDWPDEIKDDQYWDLWHKLKNLTYDENYESNFTWEKTENIYQMARDKLLSYWRFGQEI